MSTATLTLRTVLRQARAAQALTVAWMVLEGGVAVGAGLLAHSVALTAFGFDSFIELFSAAVVLRRVLERSESEERGSLTTGERTASRLVGWALYVLIAYIVVAAVVGIAIGLRPEASPVGIGLAAISLVIMAGLWRWRLSSPSDWAARHCAPTRPARSSVSTWPVRPWSVWDSTRCSASGGRTRSPGWF